MKTAILIFSILVCITSFSSARAQGGLDQRVSELSQQIAGKMSAKQKTTVAVVEFTDLQGNVTDFGRFLAEELVTRLGDLEKFKVIERQLLTRIIAEQKLSLTGVVDPASAKQLGKILGVDAIVAGSVTNLAQSVRVNARLISTETGEVFATAAADIFKDDSVTGLLSGGSGASQIGKSPAQPQGATPKLIRNGVFGFDLEKCKLSGEELTCWINVTNESETDKTLVVYREKGARAIDVAAREFAPAMVWLGNKNSAGDSWGNSKVGSVLVPNVPIRLVFRFKDVNSDLSSLRLLRITFSEEESAKDRYVDFRNISVAR
jgi:TolB-like protein